MLKIKDDVDLKELEKLGFKYNKNIWGSDYYSNRFMFVYIDDRQICLKVLDIENKAQEMLYDFIQAGLVEKVEEEK